MKAIVDNDFICHLAETKISSEKRVDELIVRMFRGINVDPLMHELVWKNELKEETLSETVRLVIESLFENKYVGIIVVDEALNSEARKEYYQKVFCDLYHELKGELPFESREILTKWYTQKSLGEVHSLAMCVIMRYGILLSDDKGSKKLKRIIKYKFNFIVNVYNRQDACDKVREMGIVEMNHKIRKALAHI